MRKLQSAQNLKKKGITNKTIVWLAYDVAHCSQLVTNLNTD